MSIHSVKSKKTGGVTLWAVFIGTQRVAGPYESEEEANARAQTLDEEFYARKAKAEKPPEDEDDDKFEP
ncbi:hypothetical protein [Pseudomonas abietaniphila]|uniref:hypothetical protein n=1 Tax=Pseudomonas abietaniphila TaxID=89065 RepID=UPI000782439C|nr:hypothetical protein [Pseudomonas abietaniphila]